MTKAAKYRITHIEGSKRWNVYEWVPMPRWAYNPMLPKGDWIFHKSFKSEKTAETYLAKIAEDYETSEDYDKYGHRIVDYGF